MRQRALEAGKRLRDTIEFWFRRKYSLAPTDPRFLEMDAEGMLTEYYAWKYLEDPSFHEEVNDDFEEELAEFLAENKKK